MTPARRRVRIAIVAAAVLLGLLAALPWLLDVDRFRPQLEQAASQALGRRVEVGNLDLSLLAASVTVEDLRVADDPAFANEPFLRAKSLSVGVELWPLISSQTIRITGITVARPQITLIHDPATGRWNFSSLSDAKSEQPAPEEPESGSTEVSVEQLEVVDGQVTLRRRGGSEVTIEEVDLEVEDFAFDRPFTAAIQAKLPSGGALDAQARVGPLHPEDAARTPIEAKLILDAFDLRATGFADPTLGVSGRADFEGTLRSDGESVQMEGDARLEALKLVERGAPAGAPIELRYALAYDLVERAGALTRGEITTGRAEATLTGTYRDRGAAKVIDFGFRAERMPVDDLEPLLPAVGVELPRGASLEGGTLTATLKTEGALDAPTTTGVVRLGGVEVRAFNLGQRLSVIAALSGIHTGPNTTIENASFELRVSPRGMRLSSIDLRIPAVGSLAGAGTISPRGGLDFKMRASLAGTSGADITNLIGGGRGIPFLIQGSAADPTFLPDVGKLMERGLEGAVRGIGESLFRRQR